VVQWQSFRKDVPFELIHEFAKMHASSFRLDWKHSQFSERYLNHSELTNSCSSPSIRLSAIIFRRHLQCHSARMHVCFFRFAWVLRDAFDFRDFIWIIRGSDLLATFVNLLKRDPSWKLLLIAAVKLRYLLISLLLESWSCVLNHVRRKTLHNFAARYAIRVIDI